MSKQGPKKEEAKKIEALLREAEGEGTLSAQGAQVLQIPDMGARIQAAFGVSVDDVQASEVLLVTLMPDDSGSIRQAGNEQAVRDGHNLVLASLQRLRQRDSVLVHTRYLNRTGAPTSGASSARWASRTAGS